MQGGATAPPANTFSGTPGNIPDAAKLAGGVDGTVLAPNDPAFETALLPLSGSGGLYQLDRIDLFNLLCVPGRDQVGVISSLQKFCRDRRAFLIADSVDGATVDSLQDGPGGITGDDAINAAFYFPWVIAADPLQQNAPRRVPAVRIRGRHLCAHRRGARRVEGAGRHRGQPHRRARRRAPC